MVLTVQCNLSSCISSCCPGEPLNMTRKYRLQPTESCRPLKSGSGSIAPHPNDIFSVPSDARRLPDAHGTPSNPHNFPPQKHASFLVPQQHVVLPLGQSISSRHLFLPSQYEIQTRSHPSLISTYVLIFRLCSQLSYTPVLTGLVGDRFTMCVDFRDFAGPCICENAVQCTDISNRTYSVKDVDPSTQRGI